MIWLISPTKAQVRHSETFIVGALSINCQDRIISDRGIRAAKLGIPIPSLDFRLQFEVND